MSNTSIRKGHFGWTAETEVVLTDGKVLTITTMKRHNGRLVTMASVGVRNGIFISHMMYQDFKASMATSCPSKVTQKAVLTQHEEVTEPTSMEKIMEMVKCHYKTQVELKAEQESVPA